MALAVALIVIGSDQASRGASTPTAIATRAGANRAAVAKHPHTNTRPKPVTKSASKAGASTAPTRLHLAAALTVARAEQAAGHRIGFALVSADGKTLGSLNATQHAYSGSISKAMLLVAYLRQTGTGQLSDTARSELSAMIEASDNAAANWVFAHLDSARAAVFRVAADAGMSGFQIDTSDQLYVLGQSLITAGDFARFFARVELLMPTPHRSFGMYLLGHIERRAGLLAAGVPGIVYAKEGWKPEPSGLLGSPYLVNQAAQFSYKGEVYGVAVTVGDVADQEEGEAVVRRVVSALF